MASDLSQYHHRRIAEWHTGAMSSYELIELLEFMPDDGRYKTALRKGDPSEQREALLQIANDIAVLRAGMVPGADADMYGSHLFLPASKLRELIENAETHAQARESVYDMATTKG